MILSRVILILALVPLLGPSPAGAEMSLGISLGNETHYAEADKVFRPQVRRGVLAGGFFETILTRGKWVNYRVSLGGTEFRDPGQRVDYAGYLMVHTVGLKLFQEESMRLWLGPQIRTYYYDRFSGGVPGNQYRGMVWAQTLGGTIGFQWYVGRRLAVGLNGGLWLGNYWGSYRQFDSAGNRTGRVNGDKSMVGSFNEFYIMMIF